MTPLWGALCSSIRYFVRVFHVRGSDSVVDVHPRRRLGGAGGPAAPFRGARGDTPLDYGYSVIYGPKWVLSPHFLRGVGGFRTSLYLIYLCGLTPKVSVGGLRGTLRFPLCVTFVIGLYAYVIVFPVGIIDGLYLS